MRNGQGAGFNALGASGKRLSNWKEVLETSKSRRRHGVRMKTLLFALATLTAGVGSAHAGLFSPSVVPGAIIGGTAGAII